MLLLDAVKILLVVLKLIVFLKTQELEALANICIQLAIPALIVIPESMITFASGIGHRR